MRGVLSLSSGADANPSPSEKGKRALERLFGAIDHVIFAPLPFFLGGEPVLLEFRRHIDGAVVYCTSGLAGGSGQKPGPLGEYELCIVLPEGSPLAPRRGKDPQMVEKGWAGVLLCGYAKYSRQELLRHGDTGGPLPGAFAPMTNVLFVELGQGRIPFEFDGRRYGLLLIMTITESELEFKRAHGTDALIARLRKGGAFPLSDLTRASVA